MAYFTALFSQETYGRFLASERDVIGFREGQRNLSAVRVDDKLLCYVTRLSRWAGVLIIRSERYTNDAPIFVHARDPYIHRFTVTASVLLPIELSVPIHEPEIWRALSFTRELGPRRRSWAGKFLSSLARIDDVDGEFIEATLDRQVTRRRVYDVRVRGATQPHDGRDV